MTNDANHSDDKRVYCVGATSTDYAIAYIEARSIEDAWTIATEIDACHFHAQDEAALWEIDSITEVTEYDPDLLVSTEAYGSL